LFKKHVKLAERHSAIASEVLVEQVS